MIDAWWKRIAAIHVEDDGSVGAVWLADDPTTGVVHIYDAAMFQETVPAVICEGMGARGRFVPVAWRKRDKPMADTLFEAGINVISEPVEDSVQRISMDSDTINQMLQSQSLRVDRRVSTWMNEYRKFYRQDTKVPDAGFPLMSATRYAIQMLSWAVPEQSTYAKRRRAPGIRVV